MSNIKDENITIYEALQKIKDGKYIMPAFQRQFVWNMEQIEKLWDSILLNYPIATFLFWHIDDTNVSGDTYFCNFLSSVTFNSKKAAESTNYELTSIDVKNTDTAVLDGQQRLTSFYLSLFGEAYILPKYARKKNGEKILTKLLIELNKNKISTDEDEFNNKKFDIKFSDKIGKLSPTQFEIKNILDEKYQDNNTRDNAIDEAVKNVPADSKDYARGILQLLCKKVFDENLIRYTSVTDMKQDDALEMFVRFNSGGKPLRKSDITMSILEAYWPSAKTEFGEILKDSYDGFGTDFIIRASLMLYGDVVKSNINKGIADTLKNDWGKFKESLTNLEKLLNKMKIEVSRFMSSWNVLLPIVYFIYYNTQYDKHIEAVRAYLLRAIFFTYFQSGTTGKLQQMKSNINDSDYEITIEMLDQMNDLRVTEGKIEDVLNSEKGSRVAGEVLYYINLDWINKNLKYEQDHLHPESRFDNKPISVSPEDWKKWRGMRNRIPNLHFLEGRCNGSKSNVSLIDYYNQMNKEQQTRFLTEATIPNDISLEFKDFFIFYEARKKALKEKIRSLLG
jgi:uncharacterized protein with ParB-like and HNH nuclease domain